MKTGGRSWDAGSNLQKILGTIQHSNQQYHFLDTFFLEFLNANFVMPA